MSCHEADEEIVVLLLLGGNGARVQEYVVLGCWVVLWELVVMIQGFRSTSCWDAG